MVIGRRLEGLRVTCTRDGPKRLCVRSLRLATLTADEADTLRSKAERRNVGHRLGRADRHT